MQSVVAHRVPLRPLPTQPEGVESSSPPLPRLKVEGARAGENVLKAELSVGWQAKGGWDTRQGGKGDGRRRTGRESVSDPLKLKERLFSYKVFTGGRI